MFSIIGYCVVCTQWQKNRNVAINLNRFQYNVEKFSHQLLIRKASIGDSGKYTFEIEKNQASTQLHVQGI